MDESLRGRWAVRPVGVLGLALLLTACSTLRVGSDYDHTASFAPYHRFAWMARERKGSRNPLVAQRTQDAIQAQLKSKGFQLVGGESEADFVVDFTIGSRDRTDIQSYPGPYAGPGWWGRPSWWGE